MTSEKQKEETRDRRHEVPEIPELPADISNWSDDDFEEYMKNYYNLLGIRADGTKIIGRYTCHLDQSKDIEELVDEKIGSMSTGKLRQSMRVVGGISQMRASMSAACHNLNSSIAKVELLKKKSKS